MKHRFTKGVAAVAGAAVIALLAGCAPATPTESAAPEEMIDIKVGILPIVDLAAFQIALDKGFFEEENLNVEYEQFTAGSAIVAAMTSGAVQIAWASVIGDLTALSQNVPIVTVAAGAFHDAGENDPSGIVVPADSDIQTAADLEGRTIGIVAQRSLAHYEVLASLDINDVPIDSPTYVEIPFPETGAALSAGRIDAGYVQEPFKTILLGQGMRLVTEPITDILGAGGSLQATEWVAMRDYATNNPEVIERFQRAIIKANEYANENPDEARAAVSVLIPALTSDLVDQLHLSSWKADVDRGSYEKQLEILHSYSDVTFEPDFDAYLQFAQN